MKRDSIVFYRGFYKGIEQYPEEVKGKLYSAIMLYAFDGIEPDLSGDALGFFYAVQGQIDANNKKYIDGCKGGRPKKTNGYDNKKPVVSEKENQSFQKEKPNENDNENVNVNDNEKENENVKGSRNSLPLNPYGEYNNVMLTDKEYKTLKDNAPDYAEDYIDQLSRYMESKGTKYKNHFATVKTWLERDHLWGDPYDYDPFKQYRKAENEDDTFQGVGV